MPADAKYEKIRPHTRCESNSVYLSFTYLTIKGTTRILSPFIGEGNCIFKFVGTRLVINREFVELL